MSKRTAKVITERDRALMLFIGEGGAASVTQIARRHWTTGAANAENRLEQLRRAGYLQGHNDDTRSPGEPERLYTLTKQGKELFSQAERERLQVGLPNGAELRQQLLLQDLRIRLEGEARERGERLVEWQSERRLRSEHNALASQALRQGATRLPDVEIADARAIFVDERTGSARELDIEADGAYFGKMLRTKVQRFGQGGRPTLYACENRQRMINVSRVCQQAAASNITVINLRGG